MSHASPLQTPLHAWHKAHGGRIVEFGGWSMPVQYTSVTDEHQTVRNQVGLFDISHMGRLWIEGPDALDWLEYSTTNHVAKLAVGQIQYSLIVNEKGGVIDDLLVYRLPETYLVVCNASNRARVVGELGALRGSRSAGLRDRTIETVMIAIQGPKAVELTARVFAGETSLDSLGYYHVTVGKAGDATAWASRTGYTGEDGFELIVPADRGQEVWEALMAKGGDLGVKACGLGARDTLRLEAAMPLYGHEMDESVNPYAAGLGWAVKLKKGGRPFRGREALQKWLSNPGRSRVGLELDGKRIARQGALVSIDGKESGVVTSGTFSPTLGKSLAMALVEPSAASIGTKASVDVRDHQETATVVRLPFYRRAAKS